MTDTQSLQQFAAPMPLAFCQEPVLAKGAAGHRMTLLPEGFHPGPNDYMLGRGRTIHSHPGNARLRGMVQLRLNEYSNAKSKIEKSFIIGDIVAQVRRDSPNGGFVKQDPVDGRWYEVGDFLARERTSQAFRDLLHQSYKSSSTTKTRNRRRRQLASKSPIRGGSTPPPARSQSFNKAANKSFGAAVDKALPLFDFKSCIDSMREMDQQGITSTRKAEEDFCGRNSKPAPELGAVTMFQKLNGKRRRVKRNQSWDVNDDPLLGDSEHIPTGAQSADFEGVVDALGTNECLLDPLPIASWHAGTTSSRGGSTPFNKAAAKSFGAAVDKALPLFDFKSCIDSIREMAKAPTHQQGVTSTRKAEEDFCGRNSESAPELGAVTMFQKLNGKRRRVKRNQSWDVNDDPLLGDSEHIPTGTLSADFEGVDALGTNECLLDPIPIASWHAGTTSSGCQDEEKLCLRILDNSAPSGASDEDGDVFGRLLNLIGNNESLVAGSSPWEPTPLFEQPGSSI